ncbi:hypothetical protein DPMN_100373 [Dreissena polymorpha]|uniref:MACPF domain-containing protein n=1 Tax=Dreissena polymorpha TaxID=45954 RepID=A0A9D4R860_DREPO|nr:hypothetical protein DPMN_100373 [Dreissena polymorpha]
MLKAADTDNYTRLQVSHPTGDPRSCMLGQSGPRYRFEVLPGGGWDNLRNKETGMIVKLNFSQCRTTEDGRFMLPDGVYTVPLKRSKIETSADLFEHWSNYSSTLSHSININAGLNLPHVGISGSFSAEYQRVKESQHMDKSTTARVQARYLQYASKLEPDTPVSDAFRKRLYKIAASLLLNRTDLARYESQLLIRDYGTHVITSLDVGAALVQVDQLSQSYMRKYQGQKIAITASASASFLKVFNMDAKYSMSISSSQVDEYQKSKTSSQILTYGGPIFSPVNFSANQWSENLFNDLVALDKSGDPIYYLVNDVNLPDVPPSVVYQVSRQVKEAVEVYYRHNTIAGCTREDSPNFSFQANADDGSCKPTKTNFTFGGLYQRCTSTGSQDRCAGLRQKNPQTGSDSCPSGYEAILLQSGTRSAHESRKECNRCWVFFHCCKTRSYPTAAKFESYWCAASGRVAVNSGFLFGGLYTENTMNLNTQDKSCPETYYKMKFLTDLTVCVSDDYELGSRYALPFAGFFSCKNGYPLALKEKSDLLKSSGRSSMLTNFMRESGPASYPTSCPESYSQHLALIYDDFSVHYCIKTGAITASGLPPIKQPPFMEAPDEALSDDQELSVVVNNAGDVWKKENNAEPNLKSKLGAVDGMSTEGELSETLESPSKSSVGLSGGYIVLITVFATLACVVVTSLIVFRVRRYRKRYRNTDPWSSREENRHIAAAARTLGYTQMDAETPPTTRT